MPGSQSPVSLHADQISNPKSLDTAQREIRILILKPGAGLDAISCDLYHANLDDGPVFDALSYAWGDPAYRKPILVNNCPRSVTVNLAAALGRLRHPARERHLWVDALCINQDNNTEKCHQVRLMRDIYSKAKVTIAWLGDCVEDPKSPHIVWPRDQPSEISSAFLAQHNVIERAFDLLKGLASNHHFPSADESIGLPSMDHIEALRCFMRFSWWSRLWTVQEAVVPRYVVVACGSFQITWSEIQVAITYLRKHDNEKCCLRSSWSVHDFMSSFDAKVAVIVNKREQLSYDTTQLGFSFFHDFRDRLSADPRDQIFGKLGLLSNKCSTELGIEPDYSQDCRSLYIVTTIKAIHYAKSLDVLWRPQESDRDKSLPTWVPDWSASVNSVTFQFETARFFMSMYNSCGPRPFDSVDFDANNGHLTLHGKMVDEIVDMSATFQYPDCKSWLFVKLILKEWEARYPESARYSGGGTYKEAFYRLLAHDIIWTGSTTNRRTRPGEWRNIRRCYDKEEGYSVGLPNILADLRIFETKRGLLGLGPPDCQKGDTVHIFGGGSHPFLLRRVHGLEVNAFRYISQCYVQGIMDGEAFGPDVEVERTTLV